MKLKEFLISNIAIDEHWRVQYYADGINVVFDTGKDNSITTVELIEQYGNKRIESVFVDTIKRYHGNYPQIVFEIEK